MKKDLLILPAALLILAFIFNFAAAAEAEEVKDKEITLYLFFGVRTGTYTGAAESGLPDGRGTFISMNPAGENGYIKANFQKDILRGSAPLRLKITTVMRAFSAMIN